jgi:hypothetical protein
LQESPTIHGKLKALPCLPMLRSALETCGGGHIRKCLKRDEAAAAAGDKATRAP